ncbi:hypothetical protein PVAND_008383 [Polypedilum vanderplanki]|uniref:Uncharacterized protein n=1 Tax=Polypedilum vanderplanki TaxID=319348 RepID=A0A9J6CA15_POLVA|nr:hypothetical protein PVAND_008383 [Polypedilum vanderplanki]
MSSILRYSGHAARLVINHQIKNPSKVPSLILPVGLRAKNAYSKIIYQQQRSYKNFGHKPTPIPRVTRWYHFFTGAMVFLCCINYRALFDLDKKQLSDAWPKVDADAKIKPDFEPKLQETLTEKSDEDSDESSDSDDEEGDDKKKKKKEKEKIGFRDRKIIDYENRLRNFSTPDKIFRYFATVKIVHQDSTSIYMTPFDFLRAITPNMKQPEIIEYENRIRSYSTPDKVFRYFATIQYHHHGENFDIFMTPFDFLTSLTPGMKQQEGLGLDQYKKYDPKSVTQRLDLKLEEDSIFYKLGSYGLISFSDYIFLLTVLSSEY